VSSSAIVETSLSAGLRIASRARLPIEAADRAEIVAFRSIEMRQSMWR
jgi:hypothetical protein